jgi:hypothetical protein
MPSTDRKLELTAKALMAQPVSQLAVCSNGLNVAMETQEWAPFALLLIYEIFLTAVNNTYKIRTSCKTPDVLSDFNHIWRLWTNFLRSPQHPTL